MKKTDDAPVIARRDALILYFQFLEGSGVSPSSLTRHHLEKEWIEKWILWLKESRKNSPETCNNRLASLRRFLEYLADKDIKMEYLYQEAKRIKRQKCPKRKVSGLSREAVTTMLETPDTTTAIGRRDLVFLTILYATAARMDEVLSIKTGHIQEDAAKPYINLYGKGDKLRTAYLLPRAGALLEKYMGEVHGRTPEPDRLLFYSRVGGNKSKLLDLLRHTFATRCFEAGIEAKVVQGFLGHYSIAITLDLYTHVTDDKAKSEMDKLQNLYQEII